jgi:hypothetical protein
VVGGDTGPRERVLGNRMCTNHGREKCNCMKSSTLCFLLIGATIFLTIVVLFFRDRFLFSLAGYDYEVTKTTSVESFKAHAEIQKWRLALFIITFIFGISCFITCRRMENLEDGAWYFILGKFLGIFTSIIILIIFIVLAILPKRLF